MPQMSPYNWLILYLLFTIIMTMIITIIYYTPNYKNFMMINKFKKINFLWKW